MADGMSGIKKNTSNVVSMRMLSTSIAPTDHPTYAPVYACVTDIVQRRACSYFLQYEVDV